MSLRLMRLHPPIFTVLRDDFLGCYTPPVRTFRIFLVLVSIGLWPSLIAAQSLNVPPLPGVSPSLEDKSSVRAKLLASVPSALFEKWRKYGQWDYKQIGFTYRDYTHFNFGATGSAAKFNEDFLVALAEAFKPNRADLQNLTQPDLEHNFRQLEDEFEKLLKMAEQDGRLNRIAADFTWLDTSSKWPREDIGFSNARWDEYRSLFKTLSLTEGVVRTVDFPGSVFFIARSYGLCTSGSSAGYVYSGAPLTPTSTSPSEALEVEAHENPDRHYAYVFKPMKSNWYTFYEVDW